MRVCSLRRTTIFALVTFLLSSTPFALERKDVTFKIFQFPADQIPRIDGKSSDWTAVPVSYAIGMNQLMDTEQGHGMNHDTKNLDVKVKVGWVGKIINIGSNFGMVAFSGRAVYAGAKAAVHHLSRAHRRGCQQMARSVRAEARLDGLYDEPRPGAKRTITDEQVEAVIIRTLETTPRGATHWSTREMAKAVGLSRMAISRIWHAFGLQPHRSETFKLSKDPLLVEKVRDIVGLYLDPPAHAAVFCVDEKPQIQALDRTQPLLPMQPGQVERRTHDYTRHGTTTLFAALNAKTSDVITQFHQRHRSAQFREFLDLIDAQVPRRLDVHIIMDNYSTHKTALIRNWFAKRPRFHVHFTPTYGSWLSLVERWFAELT